MTKSVVARQFFTEVANSNFHENLSSRSLLDSRGQSDGRTEEHDKAKNSFLLQCERA